MENSLQGNEEALDFHLYGTAFRWQRANPFYFQHFSVPFPSTAFLLPECLQALVLKEDYSMRVKAVFLEVVPEEKKSQFSSANITFDCRQWKKKIIIPWSQHPYEVHLKNCYLLKVKKFFFFTRQYVNLFCNKANSTMAFISQLHSTAHNMDALPLLIK